MRNLPVCTHALCWIFLATSATAQSPYKDATTGFGARLIGPIDVEQPSGSQSLLGVVELDDEFYVTGRSSLNTPPHKFYRYNRQGQLLQQFNQPSITAVSTWGFRDGASDGRFLAFGFEGGIAVVNKFGFLVNSFNNQTIVNPINAGFGTHRGVAFDPNGDAGNGSFWTADFATPLYEIDLSGNVLQQIPMPSSGEPWSVYGLAWDPQGTAAAGDDTLWINSAPTDGEIRELDPRTGQYTGNVITRDQATSPQGGLDGVSSLIGPNGAFGLVALDQGSPGRADSFSVYRVDRDAQLPGENHARLLSSVGAGSPTDESPKFLWDLPGRIGWSFDRQGSIPNAPGVLVVNLGLNLQNGSLPGFPELVAFPSPAVLFNTVTAPVPISITVPAVVPRGGAIRAQTLYVEPLLRVNSLAATNQVFWERREVVVEARGRDSFNSSATQGYFRVTNLGTDPITELILDWTTSSNPAQSRQEFDTDQSGMAGRFDAGNSAVAGCGGTYRNGSDVAAGLIYDAQNTVRGVACSPTSNCGWKGSNPGNDPGDYRTLLFRFSPPAFARGVTFEFDCDTDRGGVGGEEMDGLVVTIKTIGGRTLGPAELRAVPGQTRALLGF